MQRPIKAVLLHPAVVIRAGSIHPKLEQVERIVVVGLDFLYPTIPAVGVVNVVGLQAGHIDTLALQLGNGLLGTKRVVYPLLGPLCVRTLALLDGLARLTPGLNILAVVNLAVGMLREVCGEVLLKRGGVSRNLSSL